MQIKPLPPMSGGSGNDVICIEAKRICDFCFQEHHLDRTFQAAAGTGLTAECEINQLGIVCREVSRRVIDNGNRKDLVCLAIEVPVTIRLLNQAGQVVQTITDRVVFLKQALLCAPVGTDVECQVTGDCCCFIDPTSGLVSCAFDFCVVIQTRVIVRVLVPTLGMCAPKECRSTVNGCPPKVPEECNKCCD